MKTPSSTVKVITISVFTILIVSFVCYRVGAFDNFSFASTPTDNYFASNTNQIAVDTPVVKKDSIIIDREMMSSSKSMRMSRPLKQDTTKKTTTPTADTTKKQQQKKSNYMGSSKSAVIFEPPVQLVDTTKKPKK